MACFAKIFGRKHGSFNLPMAGAGDGGIVATRVTRRIIDEELNQTAAPPTSRANGYGVTAGEKAPAPPPPAVLTTVPSVAKSNERESGLGSLDERLNFTSTAATGDTSSNREDTTDDAPPLPSTGSTGPTIERKASKPRDSSEAVKISSSSRETSTAEPVDQGLQGMTPKDLLQHKILHMLALQSKGYKQLSKGERATLIRLERDIQELQGEIAAKRKQDATATVMAEPPQELPTRDVRDSVSSYETNLQAPKRPTPSSLSVPMTSRSEEQLLEGELSDYDVIPLRKDVVPEAPSSEDDRSSVLPPDLPPRDARLEQAEADADDTSQDEEPTPPKLPPPRSQLEQNIMDEVMARTFQETMVRQAVNMREEEKDIPLPTAPPPSREPPPTPAPQDELPDDEPLAIATPLRKEVLLRKKSSQRSLIEELDNTTGTLKKARKQGVVSDKTDLKESKDIVIPSHPKSADTELLIKTAIVANDFLNNMMDEERLLAVTAAMSSMSFPPNSYIIKEGDIGAHFFVSEEGTYEVVVDNKVIKSFGRGVVFGELAILYKAKRFASIRVTTGAKVWLLERKVFQKIMMKSGRREREENVKFLSTVSVLKDLEIEKLHKISDLLKREFYATGSTIIQQGDPGDKFYIIRGGSVNVIKTDKKGNERLVGTLQRGAYFGEQALLHEDRRLASIIANPPGTECLTLNRIAFNEFLGGLDQLREVKLSDTIPRNSTMTNIVSEYDHIQLHDLTYIGTLGIGGFGRVELVQYRNRQTFALKYLKKIEMVRQQQQEHAYSEKDIMLSCNSPFIVRLYKTYRDKKYLYFLMEACLGGDVWTVLQKSKFFDERTARFITGCVVEAFEYLHSRNMIYRDLKPENLMLDEQGYIKLVDFGFAKRIGPNQKTWTFAGTPEYVSPEIILNKGHDRAVDYWALGVLIHELLVGKPPFRGKNHMKTYNAILRGIDIVELPSRVPKKAQVLIKRLCRQTAAERLGYGKNGIADIKTHPWFGNFEWQRLKERTMPAPLVRPIVNDIDLSNFDEYPKDQDEPPDEISGWDINF
ncbi:cGMP-dependent protein kinase 1 [Anopheles ziemanni]|uniref:cGMP-dependent protein kinase 1 n=1 Tax=Anopheles coustani TaxID=139045 RepID=UPI002657F9BA|nr:cGMP-dependent protein kinase 1 [Anopheles coustani]XP_058178941.1 cGMP-dependent protein kinase 1 [Anopheles ziemanni]